MSDEPAPLLEPEVVAHVRELGALTRQGRVAALVGAGISRRVYLPNWTDLVDRLIEQWWDDDPTRAPRDFTAAEYRLIVREVFGDDDMAIVAFLRRSAVRAAEALRSPDLTFSRLVYRAVYAAPLRRGDLFTPQPDHVHQWVVAIFRRGPGQVWTSNFDDLLEEAARLNGIVDVRRIDPDDRKRDGNFTVNHLHGALDPPGRLRRGRDQDRATVVLAEDDYHSVSAEQVGWISREFYNLFDHRQVVMLGMSLLDPNLRRAITVVGDRVPPREPARPHFAVMRRMDNDHAAHITRWLGQWHAALVKVGTPVGSDVPFSEAVPIANAERRRTVLNVMRREYWSQRGVRLVELPGHSSILPLLVRLQHEAWGTAPGAIWRHAVEIGHGSVKPWRPDAQRIATEALAETADGYRAPTPPASGFPDLVEIGIFLLTGNGTPEEPFALELVFRGGAGAEARHGARRFRMDIDHPEGLAGFVFVTGQMVRLPRDHQLHDFNLMTPTPSSTRYEGIISAPLIDWEAGGVPLGVVYATTAATDGPLFALPSAAQVGESVPSLEGFYSALVGISMDLINRLRNPASS